MVSYINEKRVNIMAGKSFKDYKSEIKGLVKKLRKDDKDKNKKAFDTLLDAIDKAEKSFTLGQALSAFLDKTSGQASLSTPAIGSIVTILVKALAAGPCPWTGLIVAKINKLIIIESVRRPNNPPGGSKSDKLKREIDRNIKNLESLKRKYSAAHRECLKSQFSDSLISINEATALNLVVRAQLPMKVAELVVSAGSQDAFVTPNEILAVKGMKRKQLKHIIMAGFTFPLDEIRTA